MKKDKDYTIGELNELFKEELEEITGIIEEDEVSIFDDEIEEEEEERDNFRYINWLLDTKQSFSRKQIKEELGINILPNQLPTFTLLFSNLVKLDHAGEQYLGVPLGNNKDSYPPPRWNPHQATYRTMQGVVSKLHEAGLINLVLGKASKKEAGRKVSQIIPNEEFFEWIHASKPKVFINADTHVRLRDMNKKHRIIPFEDTAYTKHVDRVMKRYHKKLKEWGIAIDGQMLEDFHCFINFTAVPYERDKKGNHLIRHGGRWYGEWNRTKKDTRLQQISFANTRFKELVELDYTSAGSNALYVWETGDFYKENNGDCYVIVGWWLQKNTDVQDYRQIIKEAVRIGLNHGRKGIERAYLKGKIKKGMSEAKYIKHMSRAYYAVERIMDYYRITHPDIAHWVLKGGVTGRRAMFLESNMVLGVLDKLVKENIPVVTIYDSMVVPKKYEKRTKELMYEKNNLAWLRRLLAKDEQGQLKQP